ncbi:MAG TPA: helix-turn-helix transcriptional regulator [Clostridia bacterium]|nr:helix-turn-helix transcriptional regulator [Clostridia bacterium]
MINVHDYFAVNWEATSDNIRALLAQHISHKTFAEAMCVTKRTVENWCNNKARPSIDYLVLMAKFFNVDLFDILVLNGQVQKSIEEQDWREAEEIKRKRYKQGDLNDVDYDCKCKEEFDSNILFYEYIQSTYPISNLSEFLLVLHLIDTDYLCDILGRMFGNIGKNNDYVMNQLMFLYDKISDDKAKQFVEFYKEYYLKYPSVYTIDDKTKLELKLQKYEQYKKILESGVIDEMRDSYIERLKDFGDKLLMARIGDRGIFEGFKKMEKQLYCD